MISAVLSSTDPVLQRLMTGTDGPAKPHRSRGRSASVAIRSRRVAIVEDELLVAWTLEALLEDAGHEVIGVFANGEDAVAGLADQDLDVVCMDINLGKGIDGIQTASQLKSKQAPKIIFITAYADPTTAKRALEAAPGAIILSKPVSAATLHDAIERSVVSTN